jgi:hypothetical protein
MFYIVTPEGFALPLPYATRAEAFQQLEELWRNGCQRLFVEFVPTPFAGLDACETF